MLSRHESDALDRYLTTDPRDNGGEEFVVRVTITYDILTEAKDEEQAISIAQSLIVEQGDLMYLAAIAEFKIVEDGQI